MAARPVGLSSAERDVGRVSSWQGGVVVESAAIEPALANPAALYDAAKFNWIGRVATSNNIFMQWQTSRVQSIVDSRRFESLLAGTGPGSIAETVPRLLNALAGTKF